MAAQPLTRHLALVFLMFLFILLFLFTFPIGVSVVVEGPARADLGARCRESAGPGW